MVAVAFVRKFEDDCSMHMDDAAMEVLLGVVTTCRCLIALSSSSLTTEVDAIDDVIATWGECGSSKRSAMSLAASAIDSTPVWRTELEILVSNPQAFKDQGPKLEELRCAAESLDVNDEAILEKLTKA